MQKITHAPDSYQCPFCEFVQSLKSRIENPSLRLRFYDIVAEGERVVVFSSIKWWPHNPGHVLIIPTEQFENLYETPDEVLAKKFSDGKASGCRYEAGIWLSGNFNSAA